MRDPLIATVVGAESAVGSGHGQDTLSVVGRDGDVLRLDGGDAVRSQAPSLPAVPALGYTGPNGVDRVAVPRRHGDVVRAGMLVGIAVKDLPGAAPVVTVGRYPGGPEIPT